MTTSMGFSHNFVSLIPYNINEPLLFDLKLKVLTHESGDIATSEGLSAGDVLRAIVENKSDFSFDESSNGSARIAFDNNNFSISTSGDSHAGNFLCKILEVAKQVGSVVDALRCSWYYINEDYYVKDDPSAGSFYIFFLCKGNEIACPFVSIMGSCFPSNMFVFKDNEFFSSDHDNRTAAARIMYEKWLLETDAGKLVAMKKKMRQEIEVFSETKIPISGNIFDNGPSIILMGAKLKRELSFIKWVLLGIFCLTAYITFFKR